jgi:hypothetical protein
MSPGNNKQYFNTLSIEVSPIPSVFVRSADETRVGWPKQIPPPEVIAAANIKPQSVTIPEARDDAQLTLMTAISAFEDSTRPLFTSKLKTFEKTLLAANKRYAGHDYVI